MNLLSSGEADLSHAELQHWIFFGGEEAPSCMMRMIHQ